MLKQVIYDPIDNLKDLTQPNTLFTMIGLVILVIIGGQNGIRTNSISLYWMQKGSKGGKKH